jgi:hypothetical protein
MNPCDLHLASLCPPILFDIESTCKMHHECVFSTWIKVVGLDGFGMGRLTLAKVG